MPDLPTGTVTFLFTDVEGSVRLWESSPLAMRAALARHNALVEQHVELHGGSLVKPRGEGDSCFAVFARATDALAAACSLQLAFASEHWPSPSPIKVRMALHTGDADLRDGDYHGQAVNRCARLRAIAHGGQVLLSAATEQLVRDALPEGASLRDLGEQRLRDLTRSERVYQLCHPELPADFPALRTLDIYPNNLPLQLTSFVGREREIAEVAGLLQANRLVTLTGTGGCGKTRLALQVAAELLDQYPDGAWFVDLAPISDTTLVVQTVATALGIAEEPGRPILATLAEYLRSRALLLVLDNCEHLVEATASLAEALLRACPRLRVLATSREMLGVPGEAAWRVPSLVVADPERQPAIGELARCESVRLLVERARLVRSDFAVTETNAPAVAQVCWRLDGIALAIELAAARLGGMSIEQVASRLGDRFRLLTGGSRTALRRQQTLRAAIDWSHNLLTEPERALFRRLAAFVGGWTLEAAEEVCTGESIETSEVLDLLTELVGKSLVTLEVSGGEARYRLPETIRQYAQEKLLESGEVAEVRDRHLEWCLTLTGEAVRYLWMDLVRLERQEREQDNLRAALDWSLAREEDATRPMSIALGLVHVLLKVGHMSEMRERLDAVLARPGGEPLGRVSLLCWAGAAASITGDWHRGRERREEALTMARAIGNRRLIALALLQLSMSPSDMGQREEARDLQEQALSLARELDDGPLVVNILDNLTITLYLQGDDAAVRRLSKEGLSICRDLGNQVGIGVFLTKLGRIALAEGDLGRARALAEEALPRMRGADANQAAMIFRLLGDVARAEGDSESAEESYRAALALCREMAGQRLWTTSYLISFADICVTRERFREAARLYGAVHGWMESVGMLVPWFPPRGYERDEAAARATLGDAAFARAWAEGQAMTLEQAVEYALRDDPQA